jgi:hypothetical protein
MSDEDALHADLCCLRRSEPCTYLYQDQLVMRGIGLTFTTIFRNYLLIRFETTI